MQTGWYWSAAFAGLYLSGTKVEATIDVSHCGVIV